MFFIRWKIETQHREKIVKDITFFCKKFNKDSGASISFEGCIDIYIMDSADFDDTSLNKLADFLTNISTIPKYMDDQITIHLTLKKVSITEKGLQSLIKIKIPFECIALSEIPLSNQSIPTLKKIIDKNLMMFYISKTNISHEKIEELKKYSKGKIAYFNGDEL
jgi:hypothetical protein